MRKRTGIRHGVRNAFFTMWGDNGGECPYASALGALMYAAALAEEMPADEMKAKFKEITGENYDDFLALDLPNYIHGTEKGVGTANYSKNHLYDDPFLGIMTLNAENADGSIYPAYAEKLHKIADASTTVYKKLFASMATLCDVLTIKFSLAERTRALYTNGDKEGLRAIAENDYTECIKRLEIFYKTYREQWYNMNKTYGFEVQDARLGGLMRRLQSCKERLLSYVNGEIDVIEELSEEVLPILDGNYPIWALTLTANIM